MAKGPVFRLTPENALRSELQAGKVRPAYFFYGEEDFLTRTYTDMVIKTAGALEGDGLNLLRFRGVPDMDKLSDFAESMPFFAPNKCVRITDLDPESLDNQQLKDMIKLVEELPETTVIVFALITTALDDAKPKAKTKKLVETVEKRGAVCKFPLLSVNAVAGMAARQVGEGGLHAFRAGRGVPCGALRVFADAASDRGREALHLPPERGDNPRRYKCAGSPDAGRQRLRPFRAAVRGKLRSGSAYARRPVSAAHGACAYPFGGVRGVRGLLPREARGQGREKLPAGGSGFRLLRAAEPTISGRPARRRGGCPMDTSTPAWRCFSAPTG